MQKYLSTQQLGNQAPTPCSQRFARPERAAAKCTARCSCLGAAKISKVYNIMYLSVEWCWKQHDVDMHMQQQTLCSCVSMQCNWWWSSEKKGMSAAKQDLSTKPRFAILNRTAERWSLRNTKWPTRHVGNFKTWSFDCQPLLRTAMIDQLAWRKRTSCDPAKLQLRQTWNR